jgi:hypothetical protein
VLCAREVFISESGDYDEAELMLAACIEMQPDTQTSTFSNIQSMLQLMLIRKEAKNALQRLGDHSSVLGPDNLKLKASELKVLKSPAKVLPGLSSCNEEYGTLVTLESKLSHSTANTPNSPVSAAAAHLHPSPSSSRSRPAYASTSKPTTTVSLDQNIVAAWADYIQAHRIPKDAPSIPLAVTIGITVPPGFETHYKVAAFALTKLRSNVAK